MGPHPAPGLHRTGAPFWGARTEVDWWCPTRPVLSGPCSPPSPKRTRETRTRRLRTTPGWIIGRQVIGAWPRQRAAEPETGPLPRPCGSVEDRYSYTDDHREGHRSCAAGRPPEAGQRSGAVRAGPVGPRTGPCSRRGPCRRRRAGWGPSPPAQWWVNATCRPTCSASRASAERWAWRTSRAAPTANTSARDVFQAPWAPQCLP